jgi:hypothetical protein
MFVFNITFSVEVTVLSLLLATPRVSSCAAFPQPRWLWVALGGEKIPR